MQQLTEQTLKDSLDDALNSVLCFCGNHKRMSRPFCFQCFDLLPAAWQTDINRRAKSSKDFYQFCHVYDAAIEWLKTHKKRGH